MENTSAFTQESFPVPVHVHSHVLCYPPLSGLPQESVKGVQLPMNRSGTQAIPGRCIQLPGLLITLKAPTDFPGS